jgi:hypothetical protein
MKWWLLASLLIVIDDPYKDIDYEKINVYEIEKPEEKLIEVHYPDYEERSREESYEDSTDSIDDTELL